MNKRILKYREEKIALRELDDGKLEFLNEKVAEKFLLKAAEKQTPENKIIEKDKVKFVCDTKKIQSFCLVATQELKQEAAITIYSLRCFHHEPIYVLTDKQTRDYLIKFGFENIHFKNGMSKSALEKAKKKVGGRYDKLNTFHRDDCILKKMEVMDWALSTHENTFFLDCDIIVLSNLQENFIGDICFSPHFHDDSSLDGRVGAYNAGYIFCANKNFPDWWRNNYLTNSRFYEQECMNRADEAFHLQLFSHQHNVGFWRRGFGWEGEKPIIDFKIKSFHLHLTTIFDDKQPNSLKTKNVNLRYFFYLYLKDKGVVDVMTFCQNVLQNATNWELIEKLVFRHRSDKKVAFIHFGKAGGVYVNHHLRKAIFTNAIEKNSWSGGLKRDWTEKELLDICKQKYDRPVWAHNHHINWTHDIILEFSKHGWFTFTFVRDPKELLCSLWAYARDKEKKIHGLQSIGEIACNNEIDDFINELIDGEKDKLWVLPDYIDDLDFVAEMSTKNFQYFCKEYFGHEHEPSERKNTSSNKGYDYYRKTGQISDETHARLINHPEYKKFDKYIGCKK